MKLNRSITLVMGLGLLFVVAILAAHAAPDAATPKTLQNVVNPFAGKVLTVYERAGAERNSGSVIEKATIEEIAGMKFLSGEIVTRKDDPSSGLRTNIPMDNISSIIEFRDIDQFRERESLSEQAEE